MQHKNNEIETDELLSNEEMSDFEQMLDWCKANWKILTIIGVMLIHSTIFIGLIMSFGLRNNRDNTMNSEQPPPIVAEPAISPAIADASIQENSDEINPTNDDPESITAYEAGLSTGELIIISRDAVISFWHGFNEATGASEWAKEKWESGKDRVSEWLDEIIP